MPRHPPHFDEDRPRGFAGGGGVSRFFERLFENPQNPLGWTLKVCTVWGITVRLHLITVIYLIGMLVWSIPASHMGFMFKAPALAALFGLVLLHEFGHCFACRLVGGEADRIVMLPWGGLALCRPPQEWKAHLVTTIGGPAVNLILLPVTVAALFTLGMGDTVLFNPLRPAETIGLIHASGGAGLVFKVALWWVHAINFYLFAFNMLLVMYPFDAGRIIHALVWSRTNERRASEIATSIGLVGGVLLAAVALFVESVMLVMIALFGIASCWLERRRLRGEMDIAAEGVGVSGWSPAPDTFEDTGPSKAELKAAEEALRDQEELDRLLAKIADTGMDSLSRAERKTLDRISKKKRGE